MVLFSSRVPTSALRLATLDAAATSFGLALTKQDVNSPLEIVRSIDAAAPRPDLGMVVLPSPVTGIHRETIIRMAAQHHLPSVYPYRYFVESGGLMAYGTDIRDQCRQAAHYVHRILNGTQPAELPTQQPSKFEFVINLKTAKALGLTVPRSLLMAADELVE
jgi:ABC-type uncharacterized transport system substrate-binding protein